MRLFAIVSVLKVLACGVGALALLPHASAAWAAPSAPAPTRTTSSDPEAVLRAIRRWHPLPHFRRPQADFEAEGRVLAGKLPGMAPMEANLALMAWVASLGDEHTGIWPKPEINPRSAFRFEWVGGRCFVIGAPPEATSAWTQEVVGVGGHPLKRVCEALDRLTAQTTPSQTEKMRLLLLSQPEMLKALGFGSPSGEVKLDLRSAEGRVTQVPMVGGTRPVLWPAIAQSLRVRSSQALYAAEVLAPGVGYLKLNGLQLQARPSLDRVLQDLATSSQPHGLSHLLIDLRDNGGGSTRAAEPLFKFLQASRPKVLVLAIGRRTFSSGVNVAHLLRQQFHPLVVGQSSSGQVNHFGEVRELQLPESGATLMCSTKRIVHDPSLGDGPMAPDLTLGWPSPQALFSGQDPVLAHFLGLAKP